MKKIVVAVLCAALLIPFMVSASHDGESRDQQEWPDRLDRQERLGEEAWPDRQERQERRESWTILI